MGPKRAKGKPRPFPKGRQPTADDLAAVREVLDDDPIRREAGRTWLLEHLHTLHDAYGALTPGHIAALAKLTGLAQVDVFETASFYAHFNFADAPNPPPAIRICDGPACRMAGAQDLIAQAKAKTGDNHHIVAAPCQGACERAPSAIKGHVRIAPANALALEKSEAQAAPNIQPPLVMPPDGLRTVIDKAGLRGMGGAGFPVAKKWDFFDGAPHPRVLVVNADEGEPGTFKDRHLLETEGQIALTGMVLAAQALEVQDVFFYLRDEYSHLRTALARVFDNLGVPGVTFHLRRGAGAYVCGEETALIESLEGKRGLPRNRPPYPAQAGYLGRPTITQNVETLYWIADIFARGPDAYLAEGKPRFYSVSGRVKNPGVYRAPSTITAAGLIEMAGGMADGHSFKAFLPGGASGGLFPARFANKVMDFGVFEEVGGFVGSGALTVLSDQDNLWDVARSLMAFFADESCGQCTPCRVGTEKMRGLLDDPQDNAELILDLSQTMRDSSICGLGQAAPNPVVSLLTHFAEGEA